MFRALLLSSVVVLASVAFAQAADLGGQWKGAIEFNGEKIDLVYDLKIDGNKLTGTVEGPAGKLDLEEGKVDGDNISFVISFGDFHVKHDGKLTDGKLKITSHMDGNDRDYLVVGAPNYNGKWKGKTEIAGQEMELVYTLKTDKDKLTGSVETQRGKLELEDGKVTADGISFTTKRGDTTISHEGKLADGKITIKVKTANGDREYKLSRVVDVAGNWKTVIKTPDGQEFPIKYEYKVDGDKLTGAIEGPAGKIDLKDGKIDGDTISYKAEIGGTDVSYTGKVTDGKIEMKSKGGPFGDREYTLTRAIDAAGAWEGTFKTEEGTNLTLKYNLVIEDGKITGTATSAQGNGKIIGGKIDGDNISFDVDFSNNTVKHTGKIADGEMKLKVTGYGTGWEQTLKRPAK